MTTTTPLTTNDNPMQDNSEQDVQAASFGEWGRARLARESTRHRSPDQSNWFARGLLLWMYPVVRVGWKHSLEREDLPGIRRGFSCATVVSRFSTAWEQQRGTRSLRRALGSVAQSTLIWGGTFSSLQGILSSVGRPLVLQALVESLETDLNNSSNDGLATQYLLVVAFGLLVFFEGWLGVMGRQMLAEDVGTILQVGCSGLVFQKMFRLSSATRETSESGLVGNDIIRAYENCRAGSMLPMAITGVTGGTVVLIYLVGKAAAVGLAIMFAILAANVYVSKVAHGIEEKSMACADVRLSLLGDLIESAHAVKLFGWEDKFLAKIKEARERECVHVRNYRLAHVSSIAMGRASPVLSSMGTLVVFTLMGGDLNGGNAFATLSIFQALRLGLVMIPLSTTSLMAMGVSFSRIERYLRQSEQVRVKSIAESDQLLASAEGADLSWSMPPPEPFSHGSKSQESHGVTKASILQPANSFSETISQGADLPGPGDSSATPSNDGSLSSKKVSLARSKKGTSEKFSTPLDNPPRNPPTPPTAPSTNLSSVSIQVSEPVTPHSFVLSDVSLKIPRGSVTAVVGKVGSGKSTLVSAIVGALPWTPPSMHITSSVGYAPQKPFVISGTLRENILLGRPYDKEQFTTALHRSALLYDVKLFPQGVDTEIGERGATLSGGQQARLGIARALYDDPELLVLDDPLSAVDPKVCLHIFKHAIADRIHPSASDDGSAGKGCLLVMNQLFLLPKVDQVLYLRDQRVYCQGPFDRLYKENVDFKEFIQNFQPIESDENGAVQGDAGSVGSYTGSVGSYQSAGSRLGSSGGRVREMSSTSNKRVAASDGLSTTPEPIMLKEEAVQTGSVSGSIYMTYCKAMGVAFSVLTFGVCLFGNAMMAANDFWLSEWAEVSSQDLDPTERKPDTFYAAIYSLFSVVFAVFILVASFMLVYGGVRASLSLHESMVTSLVHAPMAWFDSTNIGRIMSRFSGDLSRVDMFLSLMLDNVMQVACTLLVMFTTICYVLPIMTIVIIISVVLFAWLLVAVDRSNRDVKRISNSAMSPMLSNVSEAVTGKDVIRTLGCKPFFFARHRIASDEYARINYTSGTLVQFGYLQSHMVSFCLSVVAACLMVALKTTYDQALIGLALTYAFLIPYFCSQNTQTTVRMNLFFLSLERLLEYDNLPQEREHQLPDDPEPGTWPERGEIVFENVQLRYRPEMPLTLHGVSFHIAPGRSVGVCGRTGAGKSTIVGALFRMVEICGGRIIVDGRDTSTVGLSRLRSSMSIIPQDPVLMKGSIKSNLDPFGEYSDARLRSALDSVGLTDTGLDQIVQKSGANWSAGERQLLCFARSTLRDNRILIMDEPTASIDVHTDQFIQDFLKEEFGRKRQCTILCIAHRINTIVDYDDVLVMDKGLVAEYGPTTELLRDSGSLFYQMAQSV